MKLEKHSECKVCENEYYWIKSEKDLHMFCAACETFAWNEDRINERFFSKNYTVTIREFPVTITLV